MSFPAPSDHSVDASLDLNQLVKNHPATFFFRVSGDDMAGDCIHSSDLLLVDRSLDPVQGCLVVAAMDGELVVRRVHQVDGHFKLRQPGTESDHSGDFEVWGVITTVIHSVVGGLL
ncbi:LexA family protein [Stenomitos frigidus]|uniref:Peptidase S24 n=1 Tax=Stenomitos frigidus ULC18 TaxID=2107698 RepID=A0A2T1DSM2_9CYAN|nr:S24 family peptidase [Stenomitos frigidus]PSB23509.1 peptidase S24 [Stenomitos frigidus ULC18]